MYWALPFHSPDVSVKCSPWDVYRQTWAGHTPLSLHPESEWCCECGNAPLYCVSSPNWNFGPLQGIEHCLMMTFRE